MQRSWEVNTRDGPRHDRLARCTLDSDRPDARAAANTSTGTGSRKGTLVYHFGLRHGRRFRVGHRLGNGYPLAVTEADPGTVADESQSSPARLLAIDYFNKLKHRTIPESEWPSFLWSGRDEWAEKTRLLENQAKASRERWILQSDRYEELVANDLFEKFFAQHLPGMNREEAKFVTSELRANLDKLGTYELQDAEDLIATVLKEGVPGVRKRLRADKRRRRRYHLSHAWSIGTGLGGLWIATLALDATETRSETLMVSLLILLYLGQVGQSRVQGLNNLTHLTALDFEFTRLRRLLGDEPNSHEKEASKKAAETVSASKADLVIHALFAVMLSVVVVWRILQVL